MAQKLIRVADFIPQYLYNFGIRHIFMLSGAGIMHLTDGLTVFRKIKPVCFHHEQAQAMAVEAYAKTNNNFAVGYFTTGPGAINALTGTAGAWLDSVPCLFISGQVKQKEATYKIGNPAIRQCGVQEINIAPMVQSITKYYYFVDKPQDIKYHLEKAIYISKSGRPGPVWLEIPLDVQSALINTQNLVGYPKPKQQSISTDSVNKIVNLLKISKRPVILAGRGVRIANIEKIFHAFVSKFKIPVVTTFLGIDVIDNNHPNYVGRIGIKGDRAGNLAIQNTDLLIVFGSSMPVAEIGYDYDSFSPNSKKIIIDIDISSHKKNNLKADLYVQIDLNKLLPILYSKLSKVTLNFDQVWIKHCQIWKKKYPVCLPNYKLIKKGINTYLLVDELCRLLSGNDVVVTDAGSTFYIGSQAVFIKPDMRYITSGGFATMGYSLPAAIGASFAHNNQRIICITGDGSFQQNIQELQTMIHYKLPIKIFVLNNQGYYSIKYSQKKYFAERFIGEGPNSGVSFPNLKKIATAYGLNYIKIDNNRNLKRGIKQVLKKGAVLCEVIIEKNQMVIPAVESVLNPDGSMESRPFEDMFPFLDRPEYISNLLNKTYDK